jgi:DNA-binding NtrC family response regulator
MSAPADPGDPLREADEAQAEAEATEIDGVEFDAEAPSWSRFRLVGLEGPADGHAWSAEGEHLSLGAHASNDVVLEDPRVSRFHVEIHGARGGALIEDLASRNGTTVDGVRIRSAWLREGSVIRLGRSSLRFELSREEALPLRLSHAERFGDLVGRSVAMRAAFARLERAAASDSTVLLEGETGTGKEAAAESIHRASSRQAGPFVVVDASAMPANLIEAELFGHERGAFTGAVERRIGAFEEANGGTIFLDELGELPIDLQPKLLRALERRTIRRIGANARIDVDVRVIAATNRNLKVEVNEGRFRPDLYYRLAVLKVVLPPLRERPEDVELLAAHLLAGLGAAEERARVLTPELLRRLRRRAWPGNVRELRNHLEQCLVLDEPPGDESSTSTRAIGDPPPLSEGPAVDPSLSYAEARRRALADFERSYAAALVAQHGGNVAEAARVAGMDRAYLYRLLRRHR